ncbi:unnamed protein product [Microthlaspi erraticum]|uniref:DUF3741 domain-containing protein n=1 Tax=Microthlaspi erraticum TaxID=1685480 RepID=A0A6D2JI82_9BRAS|nr:unnamed protein product [Microthlaspi erraticum]
MGRDCQRLHGHGGGGAISSHKSKRKENAANGCMAAFYHLFDFQSLYFPSHHNLTIDSPSRSKDLKLVQESPPSTTFKDKQSLNIPVSMRVRTETETETKRSRLTALATDTSTSSSEICNSPGSKTPNLVARLMGLDLLPDKTHPLTNLHTLTSHRLSRSGTRSLPESPRISSARKSDFDVHRLSLQLNKESKHEESGCQRLRLMKQDQEENRSPRDYARQIVKQIKQRVVTRRVVGMDITNSVKNREEARQSQQNTSNELRRRDTSVSCSPRTRRFSGKENKSSCQITQKPKPKPKPTTVILVSVPKASGEKQKKTRTKQKELKPISKCKKAESETRFLSESRDAKVNHCSSSLQKKRSKKTPKLNLDKISATEPLQKQINETEQVKSNEDASICSTSTEENSPQVTRNYKSDEETVKRRQNYRGSELIGELCSAVSRYCSIPGEIALVDVYDLLETKKVEEEGEEIVVEIEREIIDAVVQETASELILLYRRRTKTTTDGS